MCRRIYLKTAYPWVSSINYSALKLLTFFQEPFTMEPGWAHFRDFIEFLNPNLWQIGHGVHELWSDIQTNRDYYFIYIQGYPQRMRRTQTIVRNLLVSVSLYSWFHETTITKENRIHIRVEFRQSLGMNFFSHFQHEKEFKVYKSCKCSQIICSR